MNKLLTVYLSMIGKGVVCAAAIAVLVIALMHQNHTAGLGVRLVTSLRGGDTGVEASAYYAPTSGQEAEQPADATPVLASAPSACGCPFCCSVQ